jgi:hypothetical protein
MPIKTFIDENEIDLGPTLASLRLPAGGMPQAQPEAPAPIRPEVQDYIAKKFNLGNYSDENRQKLIEDQGKFSVGKGLEGALASLGAAFQGGNSLAAVDAVKQRQREDDKSALANFDSGRKNYVENYELDKMATEDSEGADPTSERSRMAQMIAAKFAPGQNFEGKSEKELKRILPSLESIMKLQNDAENRKEARADRWALFGAGQRDKQDARDEKKAEKELTLAVPGFERTGEVLPKAEEAVKFRKATAVSDQLNRKLNRMRELVTDKGSFEYGGKTGQEMESLATEIQLLGKSPELYELGVLTGPDLSLLEKITSDPSSMSSLFTRDGTRIQQIDSQVKSIQNKLDSTAKSLGYQKAGKQVAGENVGQKTAVKKQYSASRNQTKVVYSDGTEEILDGKQ